EDLPVNATLNVTTNITNATQNSCPSASCLCVLRYNLTGNTITDEYFTLKNSCANPIDITGWTVHDEARHIFTFSSFNLVVNGELTVVTGNGSNSTTTLYWGRGSAVWNNGGDTLYLNASNSTNILTKSLIP
ncbi:MAG: lamin tail domain-containing protein, partial [Nanoarchaeota archaeon]